ncbi:sulfatase [Pseudonocardia sp. GCM10023141]|uniref:sulfatase n=1 Tax=Pseudonocardia sp. GCM10023141 TaxID=3252653 RepID=UPI0036235CD3
MTTEIPQEPDRPARRVLRRVGTAAAFVLVFVALVVPNEIGRVSLGAFVRLPVEALLGAALLLVLPLRWGRRAATLAGVVLGVMLILTLFDLGFTTALDRPFDPVIDWPLVVSGLAVLSGSIGHVGGIAVVVGAVLLGVGVVVLMTVAIRCLSRLVVRRRGGTTRVLAVLAPVWIVCAVLGAQIVPGVPVASGSATALAYDRAEQVRADLLDQRAFAAQIGVDAFGATPGADLLAGLRGKDVLLSFVESYGRSAVERPDFAPQVDAVLDAGTAKLAAAGFGSRSAFLTSSTAGGGSWLAHATLLSGLWIDNQQRYDTLVASNRLTLTSAFHRADWRTVAVMPGTTDDWPEGRFYGHDQVYDARNLGYQGPNLGWASTPDQYTLAAFQRLERSAPGHAPVMGEMAFVSSHAPWPLIPPVLDWNAVGDGSVFATAQTGPRDDDIFAKGTDLVRTQYRRSIEYSLSSLISYVQTYGDDNLVLVFLGDHQPAPVIAGDDAGRDVPITIVAKDPKVLDRISGWGWQDGLRPGPQAPVWRMDAFRDRFLTAFAK